MRTYCYDVMRPGGFMADNVTAVSRAKIRTVVSILFRKWFGHWPTSVWHRDGFMAGARDRRKNEVLVTQINHGDERLFRPYGGGR